MALEVIVRLALIQIVEQARRPPSLLVLTEMARQGPHDALDRYQVAHGDVLVRILADDLDGLLPVHGSPVSARRRSVSASTVERARTSSPASSGVSPLGVITCLSRTTATTVQSGGMRRS